LFWCHQTIKGTAIRQFFAGRQPRISIIRNTPTPITSTPQNITYYYISEVTGSNLIVNGDFTAGNTGFQRVISMQLTIRSKVNILLVSNPAAWNGGTAAWQRPYYRYRQHDDD